MTGDRAFLAGAAALLFAASGGASANAPTPSRKAWEDASRLLTQDAHRAFLAERDAHRSGPPERAARLGAALTLLNLQPRTDGNIREARSELEHLAQEGLHDEADLFSRFFLARLRELHARPAEPAAADALYREVFEKYPGHPLAERAAAQCVLLELYDRISPQERTRRFAALEQFDPRLVTAAGRRDFHLNLAQACLDFEMASDRALAHFLAADAAGLTHRATQANAWIAIGELARATGQPELAARYYRKFLAEFPQDNRYFTVTQRLASLRPTSS